MENEKKLVVVTSKDIINDLREKDYTLLYPLKSFCVGYNLEFEITEIDDFVLVNRILTNADILKLNDLLHRNNKIKGIVFDDLGVLEVIKDLKVTKILMLNHLANSSKAINYYLDYVDSVMISTDLANTEIKEILKKSNKPLVLYIFGPIPLMYSRRTLLTNYHKYHNLENERLMDAHIDEKYFRIIENDYGTYFYTKKYFYYEDYSNLDNILYYYFNPVFLDKDKILVFLVGKVNNIDTFDFLLKEKTIYKLKSGDYHG